MLATVREKPMSISYRKSLDTEDEDEDEHDTTVVTPLLVSGDIELEEAPGSPRSQAATTVVEDDSDEEMGETEERLCKMLEDIRHETVGLISKDRKQREERVTILVSQLRRRYTHSPEVLKMARHLENTMMQTIKLDHKKGGEQLSDRKGNQLITFATMIIKGSDRVRAILGDKYDESEPYTRHCLQRVIDVVLDIAAQAIWEKGGPGASHKTAIIPFLRSHGIKTRVDLPTDAIGFVKLAIDYAHRMHAYLFDGVGDMLVKMRNIIEDAGCENVANVDALIADMNTFCTAYCTYEKLEEGDELILESNEEPLLALNAPTLDDTNEVNELVEPAVEPAVEPVEPIVPVQTRVIEPTITTPSTPSMNKVETIDLTCDLGDERSEYASPCGAPFTHKRECNHMEAAARKKQHIDQGSKTSKTPNYLGRLYNAPD